MLSLEPPPHPLKVNNATSKINPERRETDRKFNCMRPSMAQRFSHPKPPGLFSLSNCRSPNDTPVARNPMCMSHVRCFAHSPACHSHPTRSVHVPARYVRSTICPYVVGDSYMQPGALAAGGGQTFTERNWQSSMVKTIPPPRQHGCCCNARDDRLFRVEHKPCGAQRSPAARPTLTSDRQPPSARPAPVQITFTARPMN